MEPTKQPAKMPEWVFPMLAWLVALYFLVGFLKNVGFPPNRSLVAAEPLFGAIGLFFLFLPFFKTIKIGKILELEREVAKAKEELKEFKAEIRNTVAVLSTNVNTIGNTTHNNQMTVNIPGLSELQKARQDVAAVIPPRGKGDPDQVEDRIIRQSDDDKTMALARTRIDIERTLREALGKQTYLPQDKAETIKFASLSKLFEVAAGVYPPLANLRKPFKYVNQICNAAIHAQQISDEQANEALALGAEILAVLEGFERGDLLP